jgi:hypothetical protein
MSKNWKLFLDDERYPSSTDWVIARNYHDAVWYVQNYGIPSHISFDHDLGNTNTTFSGMDFAKWFCNYIMDNNIPNTGFTYTVHSMNPVGAKNIDCYMQQFINDFWFTFTHKE